jgi:iron only hydrogenase large subunit-like protein
MKEATIGTQSRAKVISAWPFESSSGTTTYETQLHEDGVITCNCPGWVNRIDKETGLRSCKHCREVKYDSSRILSGQKPAVFKNTNPKVRYKTVEVEKKVYVNSPPKVIEKVIEKIVEKQIYVKAPTVEIRGGKRLLRAIPQTTENGG